MKVITLLPFCYLIPLTYAWDPRVHFYFGTRVHYQGFAFYITFSGLRVISIWVPGSTFKVVLSGSKFSALGPLLYFVLHFLVQWSFSIWVLHFTFMICWDQPLKAQMFCNNCRNYWIHLKQMYHFTTGTCNWQVNDSNYIFLQIDIF